MLGRNDLGRETSNSIHPCGCGAQPVISQIDEKYFKYAAYCPVPFDKCQEWEAYQGVTKEEAIKKWNDAHPIETKHMEDSDNAPG